MAPRFPPGLPLTYMHLNDEQLKLIAHLCAQLGVVSVASIVVPFTVDKYHPALAISGIAAALFFWILGLFALGFKQ